MTDPPGARSGPAPDYPGAGPQGPTIAQLQQEYGGPLVRWLRLIYLPLHLGAGVTMLALLAWTVVHIVGRTFFDSPMRGTVELTELAVVVVVYLGLSYAESKDSHIAVDLLYTRLGVRGQLVLRIFAGLVSLGVIGLMTWRLAIFAGQLEAGSYTTGILRLPLYPVAWLAVVGAATFGLAVLANTAVSLLALIRRH